MRNFKKEMELHSETLGFDLSKVEQGSPEWHRSRAGVVSASKAYILLMKGAVAPFPDDVEIKTIKRGTNEVEFMGSCFLGTRADCIKFVRESLPIIPSLTRQTYMNELIASVATGLLPEEIKAKPLAWGKENEKDAQEAYSAATFESVQEVAFIYQDENMRAGCSPDGLIVGEEKGLELKCPWSSSVWIDFAKDGHIKPEEIVQCQFSMMITGYKSWGFAKFDPRNINCKKLHHVVIERDEKVIDELREGLASFIKEMDIALKSLGMSFGMQW
jgi:hypothetical protein